jgi:hypothetical protein
MKHLRKRILSWLFKSRRPIDPLGWSASRLSFSIYGEDVLLDRLHSIYYRNGKLLSQCAPGFYVDIGCNHPIWHSNTYMFYLQGWNGICVDINSKLIAEHSRYRPGDIALAAAISETKGEVTCYQGQHDLLAGLNREEVVKFETKMKGAETSNEPQISSFTVQSLPLKDLFKEHLKKGQVIDILSIDCEGEDFAVVRSNDWTLYRPRLICVEDNHCSKEPEFVPFFQANGYRAVITPDARLYPNYIFVDAKSLPPEMADV